MQRLDKVMKMNNHFIRERGVRWEDVTLQVTARDEKWVPSTKKVKINSTNIRLETTVPQKEETFQVVIDIIKDSTCFKAFNISVDILEIFMPQFWYTIKKVQGTNSYEFLLANKKCTDNAKVFRTINDICPRVEGINFTNASDDVTTLTSLIDLGYKGLLNKHTNIFVDHMHQPWRTLEVIINKCLSGKTTSNDKLRKSGIDILWGMFKRENFNYPELIWEDLAYQIDHRKEKRSRRENMSCPRFTKIIINHFLKQHKSLTNINYKHYHTIKDDGIVSRLKFVRIESEPEPKPANKKTSSKTRVRKKVTLSADDNIISDDPDAALELAKIMTESFPKSAKKKAGGKSSKSVVIQDTLSAPNSKPTTSKTKLKGSLSLTPEEQETAEIMQAPKERKKFGKRQPGTEGSHEGTGTIPAVPDESTVISTTSSEGTGAKLGVPDEEKDIIEEKFILESRDEQEREYYNDDDNDNVEKDDKGDDADDEGDDHISDTQDADDEDVKTESDEDAIYKYKIPKADAKKTLEAKDDAKKTEFLPSSSSLSVSLGFGGQFLKLSSDSFLVSTVKDTIDTKINSLMEVEIYYCNNTTLSISTTPFVPQQTTIPIPTPTITSDAPTVTTDVLKSNALTAVELRVAKLERDKNAMDKGVVDTVKDHKRKHGDDEDDDDEDPLARPNHSKKTKRRRTKESESTKKPSSAKETPKSKAPTKGSKISKSASAKEPVEEPIAEVVMDDAGDDVARNDNQPQDTLEPQTRKNLNPDWLKQHPRPPTPDPEWNKRQVVLDQPAQPCIELEYNFQECFNALTDKLDLNNPEGDRYPFDLSKPLPLQGPQCHQIIVVDYFFNNDLEYLKTFYPYVTYTSSITKIKAARCKTKGIEDRVSKFSKQNVYSTKEILGVKSVSVKKLHGYGHLEEITVKRSNQQLYKFKESDLVDLHQNDIEDMLLLAIQHKLFHLDGSVIVKFIVALRIIYKDLNEHKRVLRADELYKFSNDTLKSVLDEIHHRVLDFRLDYTKELPNRKWTAVDRKRSGLMIELIDKQLREREIIINLERLVGAQELKMDYKLMTRTV
uniref:Uncharacterized protein n=1 Tax=Tanacetum cinerariifolium TaxID=118510 RepID=A0A6L2L4L2_TANCI|nr:hypothetical protein [Tanacetum cinerariifolium]